MTKINVEAELSILTLHASILADLSKAEEINKFLPGFAEYLRDAANAIADQVLEIRNLTGNVRPVLQLWRCTRKEIWAERTPLADRQGHYVRAFTKEDAHEEMACRFPKDSDGFTVDLWEQ